MKGPSLFDPYFDIVEVTVYGQARFFNPPPVDAATEPSLGETPAAATAPAAAPDAAPKGGLDASQKAADTPKEETPAKEATPAKTEPAAPSDAAKPAATPSDAAKPDGTGAVLK